MAPADVIVMGRSMGAAVALSLARSQDFILLGLWKEMFHLVVQEYEDKPLPSTFGLDRF